MVGTGGVSWVGKGRTTGGSLQGGWAPAIKRGGGSPSAWTPTGEGGDFVSEGGENRAGGRDGTVRTPPSAGRGRFTAGVPGFSAPAAAVQGGGVLSRAGATLETEIAGPRAAPLGLGPDIISLPGGGTSRNDLP